ncbi:MAG: single-stranded DNA-binding protein [Fibrobacter sp.]|nr:single-stranded DNA-binding protein [Fibrobacter sp.]
MAYLNKVHLIGNVGRDPEFRVTQNGQKYARFSLATTERFRDKNTGEYRDRTDWHNLVGWRIVAEQLERLQVRKGLLLYIEGRISQRSWDDPSGQRRYATDVEIERFQILTPRDRSASQEWSGSAQGQSSFEQSPTTPPASANPQKFDSNDGYDPADDDMPF